MKQVMQMILLGICFGVVMVIFKESLRISEEVFWHGYWIAVPVVITGAVSIHVVYNLFYQNKIWELTKLLKEEKSQEYIDGIEALLKTAKGKNLRNILTMNLAAGYVEKGQFDKAISILEKRFGSLMKGSTVDTGCRINLCISYFETEQYDRAMELYNESQKFFEKYRNGNIYGVNIATLDILAAIRNTQYAQAEELLAMAGETYHDSRYQKTFDEITHRLREIKGRREE